MIDEFTFKGKWFLPKSTDEIGGELRFSPHESPILELYGSLDNKLSSASSFPIIYGNTTKGAITLIGNRFRFSNMNFNGVSIYKYVPQFIFKGLHFPSMEALYFKEVSFRLFNMFDWFGKQSLILSWSKPSNYVVKYNSPKEISFSLNDSCCCTIFFYSPFKDGNSNNQMTLSEECEVTFKYEERIHFKEILKDINIFQSFITLLTFEQSYPLSITLNDPDYYYIDSDDQQYLIDISLFFRNIYYRSNSKIRSFQDALISYPLIQNDFPNIIRKWYLNFKRIEPTFILLMRYFSDKERFTNEKFMDIMRCIETFHRQNYDRTRLPKNEFKAIKRSILNSAGLSKDDKLWLSDTLQYSNEITLRDRLFDLIKQHTNNYLESNIPDKISFCKKAADTRNHQTHFNPRLKEKALAGSELFQTTAILTGLIISCIFDMIGIDKSLYENRLDDFLKINY